MTELAKNDLIGCNKAVKDFPCKYMVYIDKCFLDKCPGLVEKFIAGGGKVYAPTGAVNNSAVIGFNPSEKESCNLRSGIYMGSNCGVTALSIAVAIGYKEIYLLGMDENYLGGDSHYHGGYGTEAPAETIFEHRITFFEVLGRWIKKKYPEIKLYNCSYMSYVDIEQKYFKKIPIKDVLRSEND
jgi:hypothetical protein